MTKPYTDKVLMKSLTTLFVYPNSPLRRYTVDEMFSQEFIMAQDYGLNVALIDSEAMSLVPTPNTLSNVTRIVYRGWMLSDGAYSQLEKTFGTRLLTSKEHYFETHYLPRWYNDIAPLTIPSVITTEQQAAESLHHFPNGAFIKDYVKSLKTGKGSRVDTPDDVKQALDHMKQYRGMIEGGIVLRKFVTLKPNSETRFFVAYNTVFSPYNHNGQLSLAQEVVKKLAYKKVSFYSIDIGTLDDGTDIVIEVGDGQVSDYVGWSLKDFIKVLSALAC